MAGKKMGAPSKKDKIPEEQLAILYRAGFTDKQVAEFYGITDRTIDNWKKAHPDFFRSLNDWKAQADHEVERSLYERACGYSHPDTKAQWVETNEYDKKSGKVLKKGHWEYAELIKHYAPDPTSMIFWLKNRQSDKWRDKQDHTVDGSLTIEITRFSENKTPE